MHIFVLLLLLSLQFCARCAKIKAEDLPGLPNAALNRSQQHSMRDVPGGFAFDIERKTQK